MDALPEPVADEDLVDDTRLELRVNDPEGAGPTAKLPDSAKTSLILPVFTSWMV